MSASGPFAPGDVLRHERFYVDDSTGELKPKYLLVLAVPTGDDLVVRLLTSRPHGRPEVPPCNHGPPYPSFFLGAPGAPLTAKTWLDLRQQDDIDPAVVQRLVRQAVISTTMRLRLDLLLLALECAANADDTTRQQARSIRDALAALR